ncbi:Uncharacterised protein [Burkholderia cenocepacia]|nr:Uncharacterised protein [Burkholderia cenocepacia]
MERTLLTAPGQSSQHDPLRILVWIANLFYQPTVKFTGCRPSFLPTLVIDQPLSFTLAETASISRLRFSLVTESVDEQLRRFERGDKGA